MILNKKVVKCKRCHSKKFYFKNGAETCYNCGLQTGWYILKLIRIRKK